VKARAPRLVGVVHLPPLPGSPRASASARDVARSAARDARILADCGFDLAMIENFGDAPFFASRVPSVTVSAMTACALAVREACPDLPLGINVLRNDAEAALSIAAVVGAACIRVNVHTGARVTDQGVVEGRAAETLRLRRALDAESVAVWADVDVKHSAPLGGGTTGEGAIEQEAEDAVARGLANALLVTGEGTGKGVDLAKLRRAHRIAHRLDVELLVASGATAEGLPDLAGACDGVIVGSALRDGGIAGGPIDATRAASFAKAFRRLFVGP
jgi:membrane complex biogenesis BtpA family protein